MSKTFDPNHIDGEVQFPLATLMISFIIRGNVWAQIATFVRELAAHGYSKEYINDAIQFAVRCA